VLLPFKLSFTLAVEYSFEKLSNQDKSESKSSPIKSFKLTKFPKNVTLYVCGLLSFNSTPSSFILPFLKSTPFNFIVPLVFKRASNPPLILKL